MASCGGCCWSGLADKHSKLSRKHSGQLLSGCGGRSDLRGDVPPHTFGPVALVQMLREHPFLATQSWVYTKPVTLLTMLHHTDVIAMRRFMAAAPRRLVEGLMPEVLHNVDQQTVSVGLPLIINMVSGHDAMISVLERVDLDEVSELLRQVPTVHILVVLKIPARALIAVIDCLDPRQRMDIFVEVLTETPKVLERSLVPLLTTTRHPRRVAELANRVNIEVLCCILRGVPGKQLASFIEATVDEDFMDQGHVTRLMRMVEDDYELVSRKLVPLIARGDAEKMGQLIHKVEPRQLLDVLRKIEVDGLLCLLEHTHQSLVIQIFRLPLEQSLPKISSIMATAMQEHPFLAATIAHQSEQLVNLGGSAKKAKRHVREGFHLNLDRGKMSRGGSPKDAYAFGDFTRGIVQKVSADLRLAHSQRSEAQPGREQFEDSRNFLPPPVHERLEDIEWRTLALA